MPTLAVPEEILKLLRVRAEERGMTVDELVVEVATEGLDPESRARECARAARWLLAQARGELERGDLRQASEKIWGAAALAVKAHAYAAEGRRLASHGELWEYKSKLAGRLGAWVHDSWSAAVSMHVNFYEGWADAASVRAALSRVERLVESVARELAGAEQPGATSR